jgi:hypothetical protein
MRLKSMMTGMNGCQMMKADMDAAMANQSCLGVSGRQRPNQEVSVKKVLAAVIAAVVAGVVLVGGAMAVQGSRKTGDPVFHSQGMMPEVEVSAEMPRLVMPTVEVVAVRTVAMGPTDLRVF